MGCIQYFNWGLKKKKFSHEITDVWLGFLKNVLESWKLGYSIKILNYFTKSRDIQPWL